MLLSLLACVLAIEQFPSGTLAARQAEDPEPPAEPWFGPEVRLARTLRGAPFEHLGAALAAPGDLDGDGLAEVAYITDLLLEDSGGPRPSGSSGLCVAGIRSTRRLAILRGGLDMFGADEGHGQRLVAPGDLDGDGRSELLASAVSLSGPGRVWLISGASGRSLRTWPDHDEFSTADYGSLLASLGDLDGDGRAEFRIDGRAYSGATFERVTEAVRALLPPEDLGTWVELLTCSPVLHALVLESRDPARPPNFFVWPDVGQDLYLPPEIRLRKYPFRIVSGEDGRELGAWVEEPLDFDHLDRRAIGDWDGDGIGEMWMARVRTQWPERVEAIVRSGADARVLATLHYPRADFGAQVCVVGDTDGNGRRELAVGAPDFYAYDRGAGAVFLFEIVAR